MGYMGSPEKPCFMADPMIQVMDQIATQECCHPQREAYVCTKKGYAVYKRIPGERHGFYEVARDDNAQPQYKICPRIF